VHTVCVHVVGIVNENKFIKMQGVTNFKIGSKVLEKFIASLFRVCLRTFRQPVNGSTNPLQNTGNYLQWT